MYHHYLPVGEPFPGMYITSSDVAIREYPDKKFYELTQNDILKTINPELRQTFKIEFEQIWFPQHQCPGFVVHLGQRRMAAGKVANQ